ncbi:MAG: response regulator [Desulfococcaceae bacterium]
MMNPAGALILIIDDNINNIKVISEYLKESGFETAAARGGISGIKSAEILNPELILLDVMTPETDGYETCRLLKSCEAAKDIPVIFMIPLESLENRMRVFTCGGSDYIAKPAQREEVLARVSAHIQIRRQIPEMGTAGQTAKNAGEAKNRFPAGIINAIRTSITAIAGMAKMLSETQLSPEQRNYTADILSSSNILLGITEDLTDSSKAVQEKAKNPHPDLMNHKPSADKDFPLTGIRILLAEDHLINQKLIESILKKYGLSADIANNGREALDLLEKQEYDLILMDMQMPVMDGEKASEIIRSPDSAVRCHNIPIIALTAHAMKGDREACLTAGMNDYISKPVNADNLISTILRHIPEIRTQGSAAEICKAPAMTENEEQSIFDKKKFMDRMSSDEQVCREFLSGVPEHIVRDIQHLQNAIRSEEHSLTMIHAHNLKGAAANLSAGRLLARAEAIESAGKSMDTVRLQTLMAGLEQEAALFFDCLKTSGLADGNIPSGSLFAARDNAEIPNIAALPSHLRRELADALNILDMEKISFFIREIHSHDSRLSEILKKMADNFEYSEMIHLLQKGADSESAPEETEKIRAS